MSLLTPAMLFDPSHLTLQSIPLLVGFWVVLGGLAAVTGFNYVSSTVKEDGTPRK